MQAKFKHSQISYIKLANDNQYLRLITSGGVTYLGAAKDVDYKNETKSSKSLMWQAQKGTGHNNETIKHTEINAGGDVNVSAAGGVVVDVKAGKEGLTAAIDNLAVQPGMEYLNSLKNQNNVQWQAVQEASRSWDYSSQGLTQEGAAIIVIVVTVVTMGAGTGAALAGAGATAASGTTVAVTGAAAAASNAAFASLASQAAVSLANNQGDLGAVLKDLGSSDTIKSAAFAALTAGLTGGVDPSASIGTQATQVVKNSAVQSGLQSAIYGDNLGETFVDRLINNAVFAAGANAANQIGDLKADGTLNNVEHKIAHAAVGCALGAVSKDCGNGALGAVLGETMAETTGDATFGKLSGAFGGLLAGSDPEGIYTAYGTATNAVNNNYLMPHEKAAVKKLLDEKATCEGQRCAEIDNEIAIWQKTSDERDEEFIKLSKACDGGNSAACTQFKTIHYNLRMKWTLEGNEYYKTHKGEFELVSHTKSVYHVNKIDPETGKVVDGMASNTKYIHPVYGYEVILDENNNIVTDPINIGTYNFYNPGILSNNLLNSGTKHKEYDVNPYEKFGNSPTDSTTKEQRGMPWEKLPSAVGSDIKDTGNSAVDDVKDFFSKDKTN